MVDPTPHTTHGHLAVPMEPTNDAQPEDGLLRPPSQPSCPLIRDRNFSTHFYALNAVASNDHDLEANLAPPEPAHPANAAPPNWPMESVVSIGPSRGLHKSASFFSEGSSGGSIHELDSPPRQLMDEIEAQGPGTYKCIVTDAAGHTRSLPESRGRVDGPQENKMINYRLQRMDSCDHQIASKEYLSQMCDDHPLPMSNESQRLLWLRYIALSTYRRIFALVILANVLVICRMIAKHLQDPSLFTFEDAATAVSANLFLGTLVRHEHCINLFFRACVSLPHRLPIAVRRLAAKVYTYGGIHSGCGISAFLWYIFFNIVLMNHFDGSDAAFYIEAILTGLLDLLLILMISLSYPAFRRAHHDYWEIGHRFGGWTAIVLVWAQLWVLFVNKANRQQDNVGLIALQSPSFWFLVGISFLIIYPWLRLRRVEVETEQLSPYAARLRFPNHRRRMAACVGTRLSERPLLENHSFATIAEPNGEKGYSVLISNAGDWTKKIIDSPPKHLWKRGAPTIGVMGLAKLFRPILVVATGSGIGPCMSFLQTNPGWPCRIVWSTRMPEVYYGADLIQAVLAADKDAVIIDTHKTGRPDLLAFVYAMYQETEAEAVAVISNPKVTQDVVFGLEQRKVPAFGPVFDS